MRLSKLLKDKLKVSLIEDNEDIQVSDDYRALLAKTDFDGQPISVKWGAVYIAYNSNGKAFLDKFSLSNELRINETLFKKDKIEEIQSELQVSAPKAISEIVDKIPYLNSETSSIEVMPDSENLRETPINVPSYDNKPTIKKDLDFDGSKVADMGITVRPSKIIHKDVLVDPIEMLRFAENGIYPDLVYHPWKLRYIDNDGKQHIITIHGLTDSDPV